MGIVFQDSFEFDAPADQIPPKNVIVNEKVERTYMKHTTLINNCLCPRVNIYV